MNDAMLVKENLKLVQEKKQLMAELAKVKKHNERLYKDLLETKKLLKCYQQERLDKYESKEVDHSKLSKAAEYSEMIIGTALWVGGIFAAIRMVYFLTGFIANIMMR